MVHETEFNPRSSHTQKMVLDAALINTQYYKVSIKGKVEQFRGGVAPFPTPRCSGYIKGSLLVTLDTGRQLYFIYNFQSKIVFAFFKKFTFVIE